VYKNKYVSIVTIIYKNKYVSIVTTMYKNKITMLALITMCTEIEM